MERATEQQTQVDSGVYKLHEAREFSGQPNQFWPLCLEAMASVASASMALLLARDESAEGTWKRMALWPSDFKGHGRARAVEGILDDLAQRSVDEGSARQDVAFSLDNGTEAVVIAVPLDVGPAPSKCVAAFLLPQSHWESADEAIARLQLVADTPALYQNRRMASMAQVDIERLSTILDLLALLNENKHFMDAAMSLCNELAARHQCERVSVGWVEKETIRLKAISHTEKFDRKMDAIQSLEAAMEESLDQDEEILWPPRQGSTLIMRDHEAYASSQSAAHLCSVPVRVEGKVHAVITCERAAQPFLDEELKVLHLSCDMAGRRLEVLKRQDRWFGARFLTWTGEMLGKVIGVEHTWWKLLGLVITVALAILLFGKATYRLEAPFSVRTDDLVYLPAPIDGYIEEVSIKVGDDVNEGDTLLAFDIRDLRLEESAAIATMTRYLQEAEKARAAKKPSDMQIARSMADQARAELDLIRLRLEQSEIVAPMTGVIIEGDLKELVGASVSKGDVLFKIARLESMYVELDANEKDVHEITGQPTGEIAFASQPELKFPIWVERLDPVAQVKDSGNTFSVRASFAGEIERWWRPGMSGVAKVNVEKRNLLWIFTHRTVDAIRLWLWW